MQDLVTWIDDDLHALLVAEAEAQGCSVNDLVASALRNRVESAEPPSAE